MNTTYVFQRVLWGPPQTLIPSRPGPTVTMTALHSPVDSSQCAILIMLMFR